MLSNKLLFGAVGTIWMAALLTAVPTLGATQGDWEKMDSSDGIDVYRKEIPGDPVVAFRGEGLVNASIVRVASVILDDDRATEWVDSLEDCKLVKMYGEREFLEYDHVGMPIILKDRDFLMRGKVDVDLKERSLTMVIKSTEDPAKPPGKYVRGELEGYWKLKAMDNDTKTYVIAEMHADPKGALPKWLVNLFQKSWPHNTIDSLRKQVAKPDIKIIPAAAKVFGASGEK